MKFTSFPHGSFSTALQTAVKSLTVIDLRAAAKAESSPTLLFQAVQIILFRNNFACCKQPGKSSRVPEVTGDPQGSWCLTLTVTEFSWRGVWKKK